MSVPSLHSQRHRHTHVYAGWARELMAAMVGRHVVADARQTNPDS